MDRQVSPSAFSEKRLKTVEQCPCRVTELINAGRHVPGELGQRRGNGIHFGCSVLYERVEPLEIIDAISKDLKAHDEEFSNGTG